MNSWRSYQMSLQRLQAERDQARKVFAARVAGVCITAVILGAVLAVVWP